MRFYLLLFVSILIISCDISKKSPLDIKQGTSIALIGNNLCARMMTYGTFETEMQLRYPDMNLFIRNLCDGGNTPGFRPHSARNSPWAFPGAEAFYDNEFSNPTNSVGDFPSEDEWLKQVEPDIILAFFGYNESFRGPDGVDNFKNELTAFLNHSKSQNYNDDSSATEIVLVSPIWFEDLSSKYDLPDGKSINENLTLYTDAMKEVADMNDVRFVDLLSESKKWNDYTEDGFQVNEAGYKKLTASIIEDLFPSASYDNTLKASVHQQVKEKNWFWYNDFKIPNGVHVYGRRHEPFGTDNYPAEIEKIRQLTANRDTAIWNAALGRTTDLKAMDALTRSLPVIETNYKPDNIEDQAYKYGDDYLASFTIAPGYKVELFASEEQFPDLANPVQMSFDDQGRLWVAVMPSYPHYEPGDDKPNDKILILVDTDNDGKADQQIVYADSLHIPVGFEIAHDGVYVSQGSNLVFLRDTNNDDKADERHIILSGFDDHDTHHTTSAFCTDPSGAIYMGEGVFLHTNVETAYGPMRSANGGFWRFNPRKKKLDRIANLSIPNPWGTAFDDYGQSFFIRTSSPPAHWMMPSTTKQRYGDAVPLTKDLIPTDHKVRPTSGLEFVSSRHFPEEVQGDMLLNNTIGFLGTKQHAVRDNGTGYELSFRQDLISSNDGNFRPVDMEFAPDGSLYMVDWHNILVGHMQHNARDPLRDHVHGRILRITYPSRPLVTPAKVHGATVEELFENLKLPEYRARYRTRRALRGKDSDQVIDYLSKWKEENTDDKHLLEGLWVSWGIGALDVDLLKKLLNSSDFKVRSAAVGVLRQNIDDVPDYLELLEKAARDSNGRVRLEALVTAGHIPLTEAEGIFAIIEQLEVDEWMKPALNYGRAHLNDENYVPVKTKEEIMVALEGPEKESYLRGEEIYGREGYCATCHQEDGKGLRASGFPPLRGSEWVNKSDEVLIKITLKGLYGPIMVAGREYPGQVPMIGYEKLLNDQEIADVLTYVKHAFGDGSNAIKPEQVAYEREGAKEQQTYYKPEDLLRIYPIQ